MLSRCFGILPIMGVWANADVQLVQFKWLTLPVLVTAIMIGFATMDFCLSFKVMSEQGLKLKTTGGYGIISSTNNTTKQDKNKL